MINSVKKEKCKMKLKKFYCKIYDAVFSVPLFRKLLKIPMAEKLLQYEVVSYLFFGVMTTVVNFITYFALGALAGEGYEEKILFSAASFDFKLIFAINAIAWAASVIFAFITNKLFVFESSSWKINIFVKEFAAFTGARIMSFIIFEELFFMLLVNIFHLNHIISKITVSVFVIIFNYAASKLFIFRKKGENK